MNLFQQFTAATAKGASVTAADAERVKEISARILGYSDARQYAFFKALLALPDVKDVLMLGVYHGRDIAFMLDVLARYHPGRTVNIVGVDKFTDTACADWPEGAKEKDWRAAGFGEPPSLGRAQTNLGCTVPGPVMLVQADDEAFLRETERKFDVIYLDTDHTFQTVTRQIQHAPRVLRPGAIICGDDYSDTSNAGGSWGVKSAVNAGLRRHVVFANWIWASSLDDIGAPLPAINAP